MLHRLIRRLSLLALLLAVSGAAAAQETPDPGAAIDASRAELTRIEKDVRSVDDDRRLNPLRDQALAVQKAADEAAATLTPTLAALDARLAQLGPAPSDPHAESPELRLQRQTLERARATADGEIKQANLLSLDAQQAADQIAELRRSNFNERIFRRGDSPFSPSAWMELAANLPRDMARVRSTTHEALTTARKAADQGGLPILLASLAVALIIAAPVRFWLARLGRRWATNDAPATRLRRSGFAMWRVLVGTLAPSLAAYAVLYGLQWTGGLSPRADRLAQILAFVVFLTAFVASLWAAILSASRPSWRLAPISDATARRARVYPELVGLVFGAGLLLERVNSIVGASLSATVATNAVIALSHSALIVGVLVSLGRGRGAPDAGSETGAAKTTAWSVVAIAVGLAVAVIVVATVVGYTAFAAFLARQTIWISVVAGAVYLLLQFIDDLFVELFCPTGRIGRAAYMMFALRPSTTEQVGVLLSALLRIVVLVFGFAIAVGSRFGAGTGALFAKLGALAAGVKIGGVVVSPGAVLSAVAAFLIGVALVRAVQRWLNKQYLPKTEWDPGVQNSVSTAVGYLGVGLAVVWAMASLGLGLERVALIASALSVGIGFGLQQIVQNFISGVIMLVERPVKVGDLISVGGQEGDVLKINVRATEMLMADRSTLLVPNSEFITKPVQNKTRGNPLGRIQIQFGISPDADFDKARDILFEVLATNPEVARDPAPAVFIDGITETGVQFNIVAFGSGPRAVYPIRSSLLFEMLRRLRAAGISLAHAQNDLRITAAPGLEGLYRGREVGEGRAAPSDGDGEAGRGAD